MTELFPARRLRRIFRLPVPGGHSLHVGLAGSETGQPVVLCHGGPGGPANPHERRFFDPARFRIITLDQRGSCRSRPVGGLHENTLDHLAADMECVRRHLGIDRWLVWGGSFGSTVALHYAESYPDAVSGLILHSVLTGRPGFERWDFEDSRAAAPESWDRMAAEMPGPSDMPLVERCFAAILAGGKEADQAMLAWYRHSAVLSNLSPAARSYAGPAMPRRWMRVAARLSAHYWSNRLFVPEGQLLQRAGRLAEVPGAIVHGSADRNTLVDDARDLHKAWPISSLAEIAGAGHSCFEPGMMRALREAIEVLSQTLSLDPRLGAGCCHPSSSTGGRR